MGTRKNTLLEGSSVCHTMCVYVYTAIRTGRTGAQDDYTQRTALDGDGRPFCTTGKKDVG